MKNALLIVLSIIGLYPQSVFAQIPLIDSRKIIDSGVALHDKGEYKKAIELYRQVPVGDTNYSGALYEMVISQTADSNFQNAKENALKGSLLPYENNKRFLIQLANLYDYLQKSDSSIFLYDSLSKLYPHDNQSFYEQGVLYFRQKKYDKAIGCFQKSLLLNPYHFRSHYLLGIVYALQGRITEAFIALQGSMMVCNNKQLAQKSITMLSDIAKQTEDVEKYYKAKDKKYSDDLFDETDQILNAKLAFDAQYKPDIPLNDDILRQMMIVMEKLSYSEKDNNFVMQYYVPLLMKMYKEKVSSGYMLFLFSDFGIQSVDDIAKKSKKDMEEAKGVIYPYLNKIRGTHELNYAKRDKQRDKFHLSDDNYLMEGYLKADDKNKFEEGEVNVYYNYSLVARGKYNKNGEKEGLWKAWYVNGQLKNERTYHNNTEIGDSKEYSDIGNLRRTAKRDDQGKVKEEKEYSYKGWLTGISSYKDNGDKELSYYYTNGKKEVTYLFKDDKVKDGKYILYFDNGKIKKEIESQNGKQTGVCKKYFESGKLFEECTFENGKLEGWCTDYYENGKIKNKYFYHQDKIENNFEEYHDNGVLSLSGTFSNDKKEGPENYYDYTGRLYAVFEFKDNTIISLKYMDPDNKIVYQRANKEGIRKYDIFYPSGAKSANNSVNENCKRDGKIVYYFPSGIVKETDVCKNGKLEGPSQEYYKNGKLKLEENYKDDKRDGYYKSYYRNGKLQREGWYLAGSRNGPWKYYYINGNIQYESLYLDDESQGYFKMYNVAGEHESSDLYYYDMTIGNEQYDSTGKMFNKQVFSKGNGQYRNVYKNGISSFESALQFGLYNGPKIKHYYNGTISEKGYSMYGKRDSIDIYYYPNSKVSSSGNYSRGLKEGKWQYYNELGQLTMEENLLHDEDEGKTKLYACDLLRMEYNYKNGYKDGAQYYYGENGKIAGVLYFYQGDVVGYSYEDKDAKLLPMIAVKDGTGEIKTYYSNGNKGMEVKMEGSEVQGKLMVYFSNGNVAEERNYANGGLNGLMKKYYPNGKLGYEAVFEADKMNGEEKVYNSNGEVMISNNYYYDYHHGISQVTDPSTHKKHTYDYRYGILQSIR